MIVNKRLLKLTKKFKPSSIPAEEIYGGFLQFNISAILADIKSEKLTVTKKRIYINNWFEEHSIEHGVINQEHLPSVDFNTPVLQAEN